MGCFSSSMRTVSTATNTTNNSKHPPLASTTSATAAMVLSAHTEPHQPPSLEISLVEPEVTLTGTTVAVSPLPLQLTRVDQRRSQSLIDDGADSQTQPLIGLDSRNTATDGGSSSNVDNPASLVRGSSGSTVPDEFVPDMLLQATNANTLSNTEHFFALCIEEGNDDDDGLVHMFETEGCLQNVHPDGAAEQQQQQQQLGRSCSISPGA